MKAIVLTTLLFAGGLVHAQQEQVEIERSRKMVNLNVELNPQTVRCLVGDYSSKSLKISMEVLRPHTIFPQTTRGETAPCINAGSCIFDTAPDGRILDPSLILDPARPNENVAVTIVLNEVLLINHTNKTCHRLLREDVSAHVRGLNFAHSDQRSIGALSYDACIALKN